MNKKSLTLTFTIFILTTFLMVGTFGVIVMSNHHHEPGCPFMPGEQAMCNMTPLDHIGAWQQTFATTIPSLFVYFLLAGVAIFVVWKFYSPPDLFIRRLLYSHKREYLPVPLYQELFSSGILNPRAP